MTEDLLAGYATGTVDSVAAWSAEAHLTACTQCRSALSAQVDARRLARNRSVLLARAAIGDGRLLRLLRRSGVPDHVLRLMAATPSLRVSWLLSVVGVLATVAGEAAAVRYGWVYGPGPGLDVGPAGHHAPMIACRSCWWRHCSCWPGLRPRSCLAFDPAYQLAVAAPFSGFTLLLARAVSALAAALIPVRCGAAFVLPGPGWLPAALLLPSLALCAVRARRGDGSWPSGRGRHGGRAVGAAGACWWPRPTRRWRSSSGTPRSACAAVLASAPSCCSCAVTASSWDG